MTDNAETVVRAIMAAVFKLVPSDRADIFNWIEMHSSHIATAAIAALPSPVEIRAGLPKNAGVCAFDRDECTVTIALDSETDVTALLSALPSRNRAAVIPEPQP